MDAATDAEFLKDKQVAFTGRLASMTRREAAALVRAYGGAFAAQVGPQTAYLIIGQEGWPLQQDGRLTHKLRRARALGRRGSGVSVLTEEELLAKLGLDARSDGIRRRYSTAELTRLLKVPRDRLRAWIDAGVIQPIDSVHGVAYFDFRQVTGARMLCDLIQAGATAARIRRSLEQIQSWAGPVEMPLAQLAILEKDGSLLVRVGAALAETSGQMLFDFDTTTPDASVAFEPNQPDADDCFELGCDHEDAGRLVEAEAAYRRALLLGGPDAACSFNLANVLHALGRKGEAVERYYQVVELGSGDGSAWNNLGVALGELGRSAEAKLAFEKAVEFGYAEAHYNLADLLADQGEHAQARPHWQAYLNCDQHSRWASYARTKLGATI